VPCERERGSKKKSHSGQGHRRIETDPKQHCAAGGKPGILKELMCGLHQVKKDSEGVESENNLLENNEKGASGTVNTMEKESNKKGGGQQKNEQRRVGIRLACSWPQWINLKRKGKPRSLRWKIGRTRKQMVSPRPFDGGRQHSRNGSSKIHEKKGCQRGTGLPTRAKSERK